MIVSSEAGVKRFTRCNFSLEPGTAVRFVKVAVSTISTCFAMCYRVPMPQTLVCVSLELPACGDLRHAREHTALHACMCLVLTCTPENMRARASCWRARRRTCVHESCAGVHAGEHACTSLVLACTPENMRARVLCWRARRRTCVHEPCAGLHASEHVCTVSCWLARRRTCVHEPRADVHAREHACTWLVLAYTPGNMPGR